MREGVRRFAEMMERELVKMEAIDDQIVAADENCKGLWNGDIATLQVRACHHISGYPCGDLADAAVFLVIIAHRFGMLGDGLDSQGHRIISRA
ncbi:MAG: hypothetical protein HY460_02570 [Parcubacteria group bacterium]|nr:hypothetical protein [Parcubacteria group bacterium]